MKKPETVREWYQILPKKARDRAMTHTRNRWWHDPDWVLSQRTDSMRNALGGSFVWSETPQGHAYWAIVASLGTPWLWRTALRAWWGKQKGKARRWFSDRL